MKIKITYIVLSLLVLLTGCAKHSNPDPEVLTGRYIFFDAGLPQTKGTLVDDDALKVAGASFGVFAYRANGSVVFDSYSSSDYIARVYRPVGSSATTPKAFVYDNLANWTTGQHDFYAYYPYESNAAIKEVSTAVAGPYIVYEQPSTVEDMVDVMTAHMSTAVIPSVDLIFAHRLWALNIDVEFTQENHPLNPDEEPSLTIKSAKIFLKNIASKGNLFFNGDHTPQEYGTAEYTLTTSDIILSETTSRSHSFGPLLFLPTDVQIADDKTVQYRLEFEFLNSWGESFDYSYPAADGAYADFIPTTTNDGKASLLAGTKYTLKLTKGDGDDITVSFSSAGGSWSYDELNHGFN